MRIAIDLQPCQTESRHRGIGRYSMELARALLQREPAGDEYIIGVDQTYPDRLAEVEERVQGVVGEACTLRYHYPLPQYPHGDNRDALRPAAEALIRSAYAARSPDILHVNSLFEGFIEHAGGLGKLARLPGTLSSVTLYDLIPLAFPGQYLADDVARNWYHRKVEDLKRFDVHLCISQATKSDAMRFLGLPEDQLFVINAGVDPRFLALLRADQDCQAVRAKYGIGKRFVMYTGNGDPRKNLDGAIRAFARVPRTVRKDVQLVLNQVGDESAIRRTAEKEGLSDRDLIITGRIDDVHLAGLLRACEVFFFPSLYEGFGLPVLEAMAAGTAVVCANNSSLPEVIGRRDAMFDAESVDDSARLLSQALADEHFRKSLEQDALVRAAKFSWDRTASDTFEAWKVALDRRDQRVRTTVGAPRLKVAMVTPVPDERTGIADHVADLLPALARRMDVDVYTTAPPGSVSPAISGRFSTYHWTELEARAAEYDQIVYQVGNSPFHGHMADLVDGLGGLVVLHDFFLSSMFAYWDQHEGHPGLFARELERSHGRGPVANLETEQGWMHARKTFPASRRLIEGGDGLVFHSRHAGHLCQAYFPGLPRPPIFPIPLLRESHGTADSARRETVRRKLGIVRGQLLITSFGFLADTKLNLELLEALALPLLASRTDVRMVFVGEPDGGEYGGAIRDAIQAHPLRRVIEITGFAENDLFDDYLRAADLAVQLRTDSRGETSKAVLDCFANGVPVIVNDYAAFEELPGHVIAKVPARFSAQALGDAIHRLLSSAEERRQLAEAARAYLASRHDGESVAAMYDSAIRTSMASAAERHGGALVDRLVGAALEHGVAEAGLAAMEDALSRQKARESRKLFIDLSEVVGNDYRTGIHRVVRNLTRELVLAEGRGMRCQGVALGPDDRYATAESYQVDCLDLPPSAFEQPFAPMSGDVLFLLDSAWQRPDRFLREIARVKSAGGRVGAMVYDLIPIRFPHHCVDYMPPIFEEWLKFVVASCDFLVCISRSVASDLANWIRESGAAHVDGLKIGHVILGCDVNEEKAAGTPSEAIRKAMGPDGNATLMVGTLEPRKRHDLALEAFDENWGRGLAQRLVIIGREGWNVEQLANRIHSHPAFGQSLFWLRDASDADLNYAYARSERVLMASDAEGFGLPIVEASLHARPLVLSDLEVFREVAGNHAQYFPPGDSGRLAEVLRQEPLAPGPSCVERASWKDCAAETLHLIGQGPWDFVLTAKRSKP